MGHGRLQKRVDCVHSPIHLPSLTVGAGIGNVVFEDPSGKLITESKGAGQPTNNLELIADCIVKFKSSLLPRLFPVTVGNHKLVSHFELSGRTDGLLQVIPTDPELPGNMAANKDDGYVFQRNASATSR